MPISSVIIIAPPLFRARATIISRPITPIHLSLHSRALALPPLVALDLSHLLIPLVGLDAVGSQLDVRNARIRFMPSALHLSRLAHSTRLLSMISSNLVQSNPCCRLMTIKTSIPPLHLGALTLAFDGPYARFPPLA